MASYERAAVLRPTYADAHYNRALTALSLGDFAAGWAGYEYRWERDAAPTRKLAVSFPQWRGEDLAGKRIIVFEEQGLGDVIQFARYVPLLAARGARVTLLARTVLHRLLRTLGGGIEITDRQPYGEHYDCQCALMSLPGVFGTTVETIPATVPYLRAEAALVAQWRERLGPHGFKIGISWQGNPSGKIDIGRSLPLCCFAPLASIPGVRLISLQKRHGLDQLQSLPPGMTVETLGEEFDEGPDAFVDSAAIIENLDLVISSDTGIVHLAGALGRPVWVAIKHLPDWRWLLERPDSPWYPTMRLFRQTEPGDWAGVFDRVAVALQHRLTRSPTAPPLLVEIAPGELIDKITILEIKKARITDAAKLHNIGVELAILTDARDRRIQGSPELDRLTAELKTINEALWQIEDDIRDCERHRDFGPRFIELARSVYRENDRRAAVKRQINELLGSKIVEEKSYTGYST